MQDRQSVSNTTDESEARRLYELNRARCFPDAKPWEEATQEIRDRWVFMIGKMRESS